MSITLTSMDMKQQKPFNHIQWLYKFSFNNHYRLRGNTVSEGVNWHLLSVIYLCFFCYTMIWLQPKWLGLSMVPRRPYHPTFSNSCWLLQWNDITRKVDFLLSLISTWVLWCVRVFMCQVLCLHLEIGKLFEIHNLKMSSSSR